MSEVIDKVKGFGELPDGWHYGQGTAPSDDTIRLAIKLLRRAAFLGITRMNAFPGVEGEVEISFYHRESMLELTLELDNSFTIAEDEGRSQILFKEGASWSEAYSKLGEFSQKLKVKRPTPS